MKNMLGAFLAVLAAAFLFAPLAHSEPIRIGAIVHLSGEFASQGNAFREGIELAVEVVNESGGIDGRPLELLLEDSQNKPLNASIAAQKLLHVSKVPAAIVASMTEIKGSGLLFEKEKVPVIVLWDSSPEIDQIGEYIFSIGPWAPSSAERGAEYARNVLGAKAAAVFSTNNEWSLHICDIFKKKFKEVGGRVAIEKAFNPDQTDFRSVISGLLHNKDVDLLYVPLTDNIIPFLKQLREQNFSKPVFSSDVITPDIVKALQGSAEGVYQTQPVESLGPAMVEMSRQYQKRFGRAPGMPLYVAWGYDAVKLYADAMRKVGAHSSKVKDYLYTISNFPGASGLLSINSEGASPRHAGVFRVEKGEFVMLSGE